MYEILFIFVLTFALFVIFYKQAIEDYNILQIEYDQISTLPQLISERLPIVLRNIGLPKLFTPEMLSGATNRLLSFPIGGGAFLGNYINGNNANDDNGNGDNGTDKLYLSKASSALLAKECGLDVWFNHKWFSLVFSNPLWCNLYTTRTEAHLGESGLRQTRAFSTLLFPASSTLDITLLTESQIKYLPLNWKDKYPDLFTIQDTPLVGEIKFITIKLRPGNVLVIPTHWLFSVRQSENKTDKKIPVMWSLSEVHHPISWLASAMD